MLWNLAFCLKNLSGSSSYQPVIVTQKSELWVSTLQCLSKNVTYESFGKSAGWIRTLNSFCLGNLLFTAKQEIKVIEGSRLMHKWNTIKLTRSEADNLSHQWLSANTYHGHMKTTHKINIKMQSFLSGINHIALITVFVL